MKGGCNYQMAVILVKVILQFNHNLILINCGREFFLVVKSPLVKKIVESLNEQYKIPRK